MMEELRFSTHKKYDVVDITASVEKIVDKAKIQEGICVVFTPHATAAITVNENADPSIPEDFHGALHKMIPEGQWQHDKIDDNGASHVKASMVGPSETLIIHGGSLVLGQWQNIMFMEFDGPRKERRVVVKIIPG